MDRNTYKNYRHLMRHCYAVKGGRDPLQYSLRTEWRTHGSPDGESLVEYRILPRMTWMSDRGIDRFLEENIARRWTSPYDCTGRLFTESMHWARMPIGLVVVHTMGRDL